VATPVRTDATVTTETGSGSPTHTAPNITVTAGANMCVARISYATANSNDLIETVVRDGQSFTLLDRKFLSSVPSEVVDIWYRATPNTGTANLVANVENGTIFVVCMSFVDAYSGVDIAGTPWGTFASAESTVNNTTPSVDVPSAAGDLVLDVLGSYVNASYTLTKDASQALDGEVENNGGDDSGGASSETAVGGTTTMSWTLSTGALWWIGGAALKGTGAATRRWLLGAH
jgi:hypothetical protein